MQLVNHHVTKIIMLTTLYTTGDTLRFDFGNSDWAVVDPPSGSATPSPRYGFVSGLVNNFWIVSHGKLEELTIQKFCDTQNTCKHNSLVPKGHCKELNKHIRDFGRF